PPHRCAGYACRRALRPRRRSPRQSRKTGCASSSSSCLQFLLEHIAEHLPLLRAQVIHLVLVVEGEEPQLPPGFPPEVDHPQSAAFALTAPRIAAADLAQAAGTLDHVAGLRVLQEGVL